MKYLSALLTSTCLLSSLSQAELIFSEYVEGSGFNKAVELTNTSANRLALSAFTIELYSNGKTDAQYKLPLTGSLSAGATLVITNAQASAELAALGELTASITQFNGNDVLLLKKNDQVIDRIGQLGSDEYFGANVTLVRNADVISGQTDASAPFVVAQSWTEYPQNTFSYLGNSVNQEDDAPVIAELTCGEDATFISAIQGTADSSTMIDQKVTVEAIVTANLQASDQMSGYFIQEEDRDQDSNPLSSEGIFVYDSTTQVSVGDRVRLLGQVNEFYGFTQLKNVEQSVICASEQALPTAVAITLPQSTALGFEAVEGMRVKTNQSLTVNEVYKLGRFGEFLVSNGRRFIPTDVALPGPDAESIKTQNELNKLVVEDGIRTQNPGIVKFPSPQLSAYNTLRIGDQVDAITGVMNYSYGEYKLISLTDPIFTAVNLREDSPKFVAESDLRIASFNVLNFFNGDGKGSGFPTARGADTAEELTRQTDKLVAAITAIDADVIGLMELENDGFDQFSAIAELTRAINLQQPAEKTYDFITPNAEQIGDDAIAVGIIYRNNRVAKIGTTALLNSDNSPLNENGEPLFIDSLNRPALAQSFALKNGTETFTLVVNHFKSKGPRNCANVNDCDLGQGAYNLTRTNAAQGLASWLALTPTNIRTDNRLILGDLNAYSQEDPVTALVAQGYQPIKPTGGYSYVFDGETGSLDHVLATEKLASYVVSVQDWHINTDEPIALDYNTEYKTSAQIESLYAPTPFRSSDHDPVIVDFKFNQKPIAKIKYINFWFWHIFIDESYDIDGRIAKNLWTFAQQTKQGEWLVLSDYAIRKLAIDTVTLTVTDDQEAQTSLTQQL